jgi:hypothetical protein
MTNRKEREERNKKRNKERWKGEKKRLSGWTAGLIFM